MEVLVEVDVVGSLLSITFHKILLFLVLLYLRLQIHV